MKKTTLLLVCLLVASGISAQNKYVGAAKCKMCHNAEDKGKQYAKWSESMHSKAFETLKGEEALKIGKTKGIADPSKDPKCLKCHSTASSVAANLLDGITVEEGVSCESCHGPASAYKAMNVMKDINLAKSSGLIIPDEKVCVGCHNAESPSYKPFDFKTYVAKIAHKKPVK